MACVQGIGWALYEGYEYDQNGQVLNDNLLDYKLPTALDVPPIETVIFEKPFLGESVWRSWGRRNTDCAPGGGHRQRRASGHRQAHHPATDDPGPRSGSIGRDLGHPTLNWR